jgi:hypothetical protein
VPVARHIVAIGLLTEEDVDLLGRTFTRLWPIDSVPRFDELLAAIDEADERLEQARGPKARAGELRE